MNDQAETVLINFLRGTGITGLSGMAAITRENYIRPLLLLAVLRYEHTSIKAIHHL